MAQHCWPELGFWPQCNSREGRRDSLCCGSQGERISRHNALRDALHSVAVKAALGPTREGRFLLPGGDRRPADILIPNWTRGRDSALDVTVTHPLQQATVAGAAVTPGHAAEAAYRRKMADSAGDCDREGIQFLPLAAESLGGWHPVAVAQVEKLAVALARHTATSSSDSACCSRREIAVSS